MKNDKDFDTKNPQPVAAEVTITAKQFMEGGYAENKQCIVLDGFGDKVLNVISDPTPYCDFEVLIQTDVGEYHGYKESPLTVDWLTPPPATAQASEPVGDDPLVVKYGDGYAAGYSDGLKDADTLAANLDHVSTQWVQLHQELSTALGLDFEPNEDIERYTEAINVLRAALQVATEAHEAAEKANGRLMEFNRQLAIGIKTSLVLSNSVHNQLDTMLFNTRQMAHMEPEQINRALKSIMDTSEKTVARLRGAQLIALEVAATPREGGA